ncbi:unnamed protein product [Lactuca virosa]|uniref:Uncharacterized protein n=1 Tax=Lactuca virosa TaxID=75947 RepID=A0AAU9NVV1_9ASTR|nr:unnamed protein product [Lactuca virosa]
MEHGITPVLSPSRILNPKPNVSFSSRHFSSSHYSDPTRMPPAAHRRAPPHLAAGDTLCNRRTVNDVENRRNIAGDRWRLRCRRVRVGIRRNRMLDDLSASSPGFIRGTSVVRVHSGLRSDAVGGAQVILNFDPMPGGARCSGRGPSYSGLRSDAGRGPMQWAGPKLLRTSVRCRVGPDAVGKAQYVLLYGTQFSREELEKIAVLTPFVQPRMFIL